MDIVKASIEEAKSSSSEAQDEMSVDQQIQNMMQMGNENSMMSDFGGQNNNKRNKRRNKARAKNNQRGLKLSQNMRMFAK